MLSRGVPRLAARQQRRSTLRRAASTRRCSHGATLCMASLFHGIFRTPQIPARALFLHHRSRFLSATRNGCDARDHRVNHPRHAGAFHPVMSVYSRPCFLRMRLFMARFHQTVCCLPALLPPPRPAPETPGQWRWETRPDVRPAAACGPRQSATPCSCAAP